MLSTPLTGRETESQSGDSFLKALSITRHHSVYLFIYCIFPSGMAALGMLGTSSVLFPAIFQCSEMRFKYVCGRKGGRKGGRREEEAGFKLRLSGSEACLHPLGTPSQQPVKQALRFSNSLFSPPRPSPNSGLPFPHLFPPTPARPKEGWGINNGGVSGSLFLHLGPPPPPPRLEAPEGRPSCPIPCSCHRGPKVGRGCVSRRGALCPVGGSREVQHLSKRKGAPLVCAAARASLPRPVVTVVSRWLPWVTEDTLPSARSGPRSEPRTACCRAGARIRA